MEISTRLRAAREALGLKQNEFATKSGVSYSVYQKYEMGLSVPGGEAIRGFVGLGINANWLLIGAGQMLLADQAKPGGLDMDRLRLAVETVEEGLSAARATMEPGKKADLVLAVYDLLEEPGVNKERVLKLVKLAA